METTSRQRDLFGPRPAPDFDGADYERPRDGDRLTGQIRRVLGVLETHGWLTLRELARLSLSPEASASAQLRNLRKERFGAHTIERRHVGGGLYEYRLAK